MSTVKKQEGAKVPGDKQAKGRGFGKEKARLEEIRKTREQASRSLIRQYSNGYTAHWIDMHPHCKIFRDVNNGTDVVAFPEEQIVLLNQCWVVVMFLDSTDDLDRIEKEMHLERTADYPECTVITIKHGRPYKKQETK